MGLDVGHDLIDQACRHGQDHEIHILLKALQRLERSHAVDLRLGRMDGQDLALEPFFQEVLHDDGTGLHRVVGCPDDGDGRRVEEFIHSTTCYSMAASCCSRTHFSSVTRCSSSMSASVRCLNFFMPEMYSFTEIGFLGFILMVNLPFSTS